MVINIIRKDEMFRAFFPPAWLFIAVFSVYCVPVPARADAEAEIMIKGHRFIPNSIEAPQGSKIRLKVTNGDDTMEEFESFELNREKLIAPGGSVVIFIPKLAPGTYEFFGEFHPDTARGHIVVR